MSSMLVLGVLLLGFGVLMLLGTHSRSRTRYSDRA